MLISENTGNVGKNFQNSADIIIVIVVIVIAIAKDGNDGYRADSDCLGNVRVNAAIGGDVVTA
jgi:hypothetical protein